MCTLTSKVAIVVGASQGIGREIASLFANAGASLVVAARDAARLDDLTSKIEAAGGVAVSVALDITDTTAVASLIKTTLLSFGRLDILVNSAGGMGDDNWAPLIDMTEEQWDRVVNVNLRSSFVLAQHAARVMQRQGAGVIIHMSSRGATTPNPSNAQYCAAKAGLESLTRSMALEWGQHGIRVNAIAPGLITTEATQAIVGSGDQRRRAENQSPLGRLGTPSDVAALALFLASDNGSWITGTTISINGGSLIPSGYMDFIDTLSRRGG